jgi:hypothetical protein
MNSARFLKMFQLIGLVSMIGLSQCARDRDNDDYKRDKVEEDLAKVQSIAGQYWVELISNQTGESLGKVGLELEADTRVDTIRDQVPVLKSILKLQSSSVLKLVFQRSSFDIYKNTFKSTLILQAQGSSYEVDLSGIIKGDVIEAKISTFGYEELGGRMRLERVVSSQSYEETFREGIRDGRLPYGTIKKFYQGRSSEGRNVSLLIHNEKQTPDERFQLSFLPRRQVEAILTISPTFDPTFTQAFLEGNGAILNASQDRTSNEGAFTLNLNCKRVGFLGQLEQLECRYYSSLNGFTLNFNFTEVIK